MILQVHFEERCFLIPPSSTSKGKRTRLRKDAIPTLFAHSKHTKKRASPKKRQSASTSTPPTHQESNNDNEGKLNVVHMALNLGLLLVSISLGSFDCQLHSFHMLKTCYGIQQDCTTSRLGYICLLPAEIRTVSKFGMLGDFTSEKVTMVACCDYVVCYFVRFHISTVVENTLNTLL